MATESHRQSAQVRRRSRQGAILIAVLTCLLVATALVAGALRSSIAARRESKLELQMQQTVQLLDAGVTRLQLANATEQAQVIEAETWDVHSAFVNHSLAEVRYQRVNASDRPTVRCTARIGQASAPNTITQLYREIELGPKDNTTPLPENNGE